MLLLATKRKWGNHPSKNKMYFCFAYSNDLENAYAFYCARYKDLSYKEFLELGITEFMMKFNSIPESEPLYTILKSRTINTNTIKDKEEKKYWNNLKRINRIPDEYISSQDILESLNQRIKEIKL